jgi:hypothetical protein
MLFTVFGWRNQEGWYRWAGHAAHVGQMRNAQIMKGKDRPKRAWKNTGRGVRKCVNQVQDGTVRGYIKGKLTDCHILFSRRTALCSIGPSVTYGLRCWLKRSHYDWSTNIGFWYHCHVTFLYGQVPAVNVFIVVLNCQQQFVTSVQANWTANSSLLPLCKQTELPTAGCYHRASKLNKLNCQQKFVTSVQANWTVSSSLLPACKQTELSAAVFYHCANKAVPFTINNNCCQYHNAKLKPYMQYIGTV